MKVIRIETVAAAGDFISVEGVPSMPGEIVGVYFTGSELGGVGDFAITEGINGVQRPVFTMDTANTPTANTFFVPTVAAVAAATGAAGTGFGRVGLFGGLLTLTGLNWTEGTAFRMLLLIDDK